MAANADLTSFFGKVTSRLFASQGLTSHRITDMGVGRSTSFFGLITLADEISAVSEQEFSPAEIDVTRKSPIQAKEVDQEAKSALSRLDDWHEKLHRLAAQPLTETTKAAIFAHAAAMYDWMCSSVIPYLSELERYRDAHANTDDVAVSTKQIEQLATDNSILRNAYEDLLDAYGRECDENLVRMRIFEVTMNHWGAIARDRGEKCEVVKDPAGCQDRDIRGVGGRNREVSRKSRCGSDFAGKCGDGLVEAFVGNC